MNNGKTGPMFRVTDKREMLAELLETNPSAVKVIVFCGNYTPIEFRTFRRALVYANREAQHNGQDLGAYLYSQVLKAMPNVDFDRVVYFAVSADGWYLGHKPFAIPLEEQHTVFLGPAPDDKETSH